MTRKPVDPAAVYPIYLELLTAAVNLARIDGRYIDLDAARIAFDDFMFAINEAQRLGTRAALNECAAKAADFAVATGADAIPGYVESLIIPDSPVSLEFQRKLLERDIAEARRRAERRA